MKCLIRLNPFFILMPLLAFDSVKASVLFLLESVPQVANGTGSEVCVFDCIDV